ncbi:MAG TPA: hypothetical protein PLV92_13850, partial [Pirellulaceae bacterium]|nr:hypothetical protein [Pirellulaceae bacterium]
GQGATQLPPTDQGSRWSQDQGGAENEAAPAEPQGYSPPPGGYRPGSTARSRETESSFRPQDAGEVQPANFRQ